MAKYIFIVIAYYMICSSSSFATCYDDFNRCKEDCDGKTGDRTVYQCKSACTNSLVSCSRLSHTATRMNSDYMTARKDNFTSASHNNNPSASHKNKPSIYQITLDNEKTTNCRNISINSSSLSCRGDLDIDYPVSMVKKIVFELNGKLYNLQNQSDDFYQLVSDAIN